MVKWLGDESNAMELQRAQCVRLVVGALCEDLHSQRSKHQFAREKTNLT